MSEGKVELVYPRWPPPAVSPSAPKVYLAGPAHMRSLEEITEWRRQARHLLALRGIGVIDPLRGGMAEYIAGGWKNGPVPGTDHPQERCRLDVQRCDAVLVYLRDVPVYPSVGTVIELAWADLLRKPVVSVIDPLRIEPTPYDFHDMLRHMTGTLVSNLEEAADVLAVLLSDC